MQRSVITGKNERTNKQTKFKQLTTPNDPQSTAFMESLLCKALDTSFSQEATLDSPCSWTSSCFHTPQRRGSCQDHGNGWLSMLSVTGKHSPCQQDGWRGVQPRSGLCSCSALPGMDSPCSICLWGRQRLTAAVAGSALKMPDPACGLCPCHAGGVEGPSQGPVSV